MEELEKKYIQLLLNRCINFNRSKSLMIHIDFKEHLRFAEMVKLEANKMGIFDICINLNDMDDIHEYLKNTPIDEIKVNPLIDHSNWDKYAMKGGALLFLISDVPGLMEDIEEEKIMKWSQEVRKTNPYYKENVSKYNFPWCIAALPNERWAKKVFNDSNNSYEKLYLNIMKMCMIDKKDPVKAWQEYIEKSNYYKNKLNELNIKTMHLTNSLGTNLTLEIPDKNKWINLDKSDSYGGQMIANMPSYEIFTSPDYRKTNGIVYSSRPLYYNDCCINNFNITFKDGEVVSCFAEKGQKILEKLIFENENAKYLGEVALVPFNSPISNTKIVYNETLFDENASCHLALGRGFPKSFYNNEFLSDEELVKMGLNLSSTHVDFMFGTDDLNIEAETNEGKKLIFKNGDFNI